MSRHSFKSRKIWLGVGASVIISTLAGTGQAAPPVPAVGHMTGGDAWTPNNAIADPSSTSAFVQLVAGGEGGEGGEGGIDPSLAATDPVAWNVALGVIAAHILAGDAAFAAGQTDAGQEMFAHAYAEIYAEMEEYFVKRGAAELGNTLNAGIAITNESKDSTKISEAAAAIMASLDDAVSKGPLGSTSLAVRAKTLAQLLDRAALQYQAATGDPDYEPYLDGLGFTMAAARLAQATLTDLGKDNPKAAEALSQVLKIAQTAYPSANKPARPTVEIGKFLADTSRAMLSISSLR